MTHSINALRHRGYAARVEFDARDNIFVGRVVGISDSITFHGETVTELRTDFEQAIAFYLDTNPAPQKPASGNLMLRVDPELHSAISGAAQIAKQSVNQWASRVFRQAVGETA